MGMHVMGHSNQAVLAEIIAGRGLRRQPVCIPHDHLTPKETER